MYFNKSVVVAASIVVGSVVVGASPAMADLSNRQLIACRDEVHFGITVFPICQWLLFRSGMVATSPAATPNGRWNGMASGPVAPAVLAPVTTRVHKDTILKQRDRHKPESEAGGFYYDRHIAAWRDPDGQVCHTCTPENGFPDHGAHDRAHRQHKTKLERQMTRSINNSLSQGDIDMINALAYDN